jgi:hypothetical protein
MKIKTLSTLVAAPLLAFAFSSSASAASQNLTDWTAQGFLHDLSSGSATLSTGDNTSSVSTSAFSIPAGETGSGATGSFGSILSQSFNFAQGFTISFHYDFKSDDYLANKIGAFSSDFAVLSLGSNEKLIASVFTPSVAANGEVSGDFSYTFNSAFNDKISFVASNAPDNLGNSDLTISNVNISAVPEAGELAMLALGLPMLAVAARRKQKA